MNVRGIAVSAGLTALLVSASAALAASTTPTGGKINVFVTGSTQTKSKITVTGAIGDYGTALSVDANGKTDANGAYEKITLKRGGFLVDATVLDKHLQQAFNRATPSPANCSITVSATGVTTIEDGTGAYAGISGKATLTYVFAGVFPKTAKGCDAGNSAPLYGAFQSAEGSGSVSFKTT